MPTRDNKDDAETSFPGATEADIPAPVQNQENDLAGRAQSAVLEDGDRRRHAPSTDTQPRPTRTADQDDDDDDETASYDGLNEAELPSPVQNPDEAHLYHHDSLESIRDEENEERNEFHALSSIPSTNHSTATRLTTLYTVSYLIIFAILGTLARLGLQAITFYPGAPIAFSELWANLAGSIIFGFLAEDRMLLREGWTPSSRLFACLGVRKRRDGLESSSSSGDKEKHSAEDFEKANKAHNTTRKTTPIYIGLATGFCGSFTSFSSFIRDIFFALSNDMPTPLSHPASYASTPPTSPDETVPRNGGYSFMAVLAVIITTVMLCTAGLKFGAHIAIFTEPFTPTLPHKFLRRIIDPLAVVLAFGSWLGAVLLSIFPPANDWRGRATYAIVFAPLGCLLRFYASRLLNPRLAAFPLGTFAVNMLGTAIIGMSYDLQHVSLSSGTTASGMGVGYGGLVGCQVLQGIEDGFCGALTTVSTWVGELTSLRRRHAYVYGAASVLVALALLVCIMGSVRWTVGFGDKMCSS